ncbi:hypothetical protein FNV43_RR09952 [Rhamnella rubrinervis]|uniref:Uncharacterized protein n=1 Tax=Rhamnella rubrinervis TaxID=2594499 RepID=A0A8K0MK96_9ROSA|nr:hypothetical protein FNV43_RR09952 [Rhamnella rubrinervis]
MRGCDLSKNYLGEDLDLDVMMDHIFILIRFLSSMDDNAMATAEVDKLGHDVVNIKGEKSTIVRLKFAFIVYKFVVACLESLKEAGAITTFVFGKVKLLVESRKFELLLLSKHGFSLAIRLETKKSRLVILREELGEIANGSDNNINKLDSSKELEGQITQISIQLKSLAKEFDIMITSFGDMDRSSVKIISALALSSSLLAFITKNGLLAHLVQNLAERLLHMDHEARTNLHRLMEVSGHPKMCFGLQFRNQVFSIGCEARDVLTVCNHAVSGIACLISDRNRANNEASIFEVVKDGLQLLFKILAKLMYAPFRTPKYYFRLSHHRAAIDIFAAAILVVAAPPSQSTNKVRALLKLLQ